MQYFSEFTIIDPFFVLEEHQEDVKRIMSYNDSTIKNYLVKLGKQERLSKEDIEQHRMVLELFGNEYLARCLDRKQIIYGVWDVGSFFTVFYTKKVVGANRAGKKAVRNILRKFFHYLVDEATKLN